MRIAAFALAAALTAGGAYAQIINDSQSISPLREQALADQTAWNLVESLTTEIGPRPAGQANAARAKDWALQTLTRLGFKNVHAEPFLTQAFVRGAESAAVVAPYPQALSIVGLGRSGETSPEGITAPIQVFKTYADMLAMPAGSLTGKIVVLVQPMLKSTDGSGYGVLSAIRRNGPGEAAKRGAVAFMMRSASTDDTRLPHTGEMFVNADHPRIPAAALSPPDAEQLDRMAQRGKPVIVTLKLANTLVEGAPAWNVSGDLLGTGDEIIIVGGHLDSWDQGTGAIDDGAGVAITTAAAKLATQTQRKRTLRVVLWGSEEMNFSSAAYAKAHAVEIPKIVLAGESDTGDGPVWAVRLPPGVAKHPAMAQLLAQLAPLKAPLYPDGAMGGGEDVADLYAQGVPTISLRPDTLRYWDLHHSADDTLDKIDPAKLAQSVAVWTLVLAAAADADIDFRHPDAPKGLGK